MNGETPAPVVLELSSQQRKELHGALLEAFPTSAALTRMVDFELSENLAAITTGGSLNDVVYELIQWAQSTGALGRLVNAARVSNPGNPRLRRFEESIVRDRNARPEDPGLRQFADQVKLAPGPAAPPAEIERIVSQSARFRNPDDFRRAQSLGELAVCVVEVGRDSRSTGFLVGPDLVMTAYYAVDPVLKGQLKASDVNVRFDFRTYGDGQLLSPGQPYTLAPDAIVDSSPLEALDYAVLRIKGRPGEDPVAGQAGAPPRGWLKPGNPHTFQPGESLFVVQHPGGGPLTFAHGPFVSSVLGGGPGSEQLEGGGRSGEPRILYRVPTEPGSGGAPVFSSDWDLVGIHEGVLDPNKRDVKRGVPMAPIAAQLRAKGVI